MRVIYLSSEQTMHLPKLLAIIFSLQTLAADSKICVATEENRYLCTDNATKANKYRDYSAHHNFNVGVEQRVDGSKEEKAAVEEVMRLMNEYLDTEVLVKPEYGPVLEKWCV